MKKLSDLIDIRKFSIKELFSIRGGAKVEQVCQLAGCSTWVCNTSGCNSAGCIQSQCSSIACSSASCVAFACSTSA